MFSSIAGESETPRGDNHDLQQVHEIHFQGCSRLSPQTRAARLLTFSVSTNVSKAKNYFSNFSQRVEPVVQLPRLTESKRHKLSRHAVGPCNQRV
jgi:hypothetical protein